MRRSPRWTFLARFGVVLVLCVSLAGCSRLSAASGSEPSIPEGQCIMSGISTREDPDLGTQAQAILQARSVNVSAVVGAVLGERAKQVATALRLSAGETGPLKLGEISLHVSAGDPNSERLVRMSSAKVKAAETQGLTGAAFLTAVDGI